MSKITRDELVDFLKQCGWKTDRYGHLQKEIAHRHRETGERVIRLYRVKLQATSVRIEFRITQGDGSKEWLRVGGAYFKDVVRLPDGRIRVGTYFFKKTEVL